MRVGEHLAPEVETPFRRFLSEFARSRLALVGLGLFVGIVFVAVAAPWIAPQNPYDLSQLDILAGHVPPGGQTPAGQHFWLGSDGQGRDMLSALLFGLRTSLVVGATSTLIAASLGAVLGLLAAFVGGHVDSIIMRIADIQLSLPAILIGLILLAVLGKGVDKVIVALIAVQWAYYARTVRSAALVEREKEYIQAVECLVLPRWRVLLIHLLPNCMSSLIVIATVQVAHAISLEATLSFLGLGVPITEPSLGLLVANGFEYLLAGEYWISFFPGIALLVTVVSINLVGDHLRDVLNPRLAK
jgi:peptide/nickel transport system permease protein